MGKVMTTTEKVLIRTCGKPLTTTMISAMKAGQILSDGAIDTGAGRLKIRKRVNSKGGTGSVQLLMQVYDIE
jgi:GTP:adenosylcobinamide-phosphate guanylyltransferase